MTQINTVRRGPKPNPRTRGDLIRAGLRLMHDGGFNATGIKDIVMSAEVPKGSFYNHFASKEAFGAEVADAYFEESLTGMRAILQDEQTEPLKRLRRYFEDRTARLRASGYVRGCLLGNFTLETADHSDIIRARVEANFTTWAELLEECVTQAQEDGSISSTLPAHTLAQFLLNSWEGALLRARSERDDAPLREFTDVVFNSLLS